MIGLYIVVALLVAAVWVDYFRQIDVFDAEKNAHLLLAFALGACTVLPIFAFEYFRPADFTLAMGPTWGEIFLYFLVEVALVEEFCKLLPLLLFMRFNKKALSEPLDYLLYVSVSALGFAAVENVLYYYYNGSAIIDSRSLLSTVGHMFDSSLAAYGIILFRFHPKKYHWSIMPLFFLAGVLAHAIYNTIIGVAPNLFGYLLLVVYYMFSLSLFVVILNNALNNSPHFSYAKVVNSHKVTNRIISAYIVVFTLQFIGLMAELGWEEAIYGISASTYSSVFILSIVSVRLARFTLIENRWFPLKLEMPFEITSTYLDFDEYGPQGNGRGGGGITIKGDPYNETLITSYYQQNFQLVPAQKRFTRIGYPHRAYLDQKIFIEKDVAVYRIKLFSATHPNTYDVLYVKPKRKGQSFTKKGTPIVALVSCARPPEEVAEQTPMRDFKFIEWCFLKPDN